MFTNKLRRESTSYKKIKIKTWYRILGTKIQSYEEFHGQIMQILEENKLYSAK